MCIIRDQIKCNRILWGAIDCFLLGLLKKIIIFDFRLKTTGIVTKLKIMLKPIQ
jgi:hypothetical protein